MALNTLVNGLMVKPMALELRLLQMEQSMTVVGLMASLTEVNAHTQMVKSMKESGKMGNHLVKVLKLG